MIHRDEAEPIDRCYLGDVVDMEPRFVVLRPPRDDYHWAKRGAVVVGGVLLVWYGLIWWAAS